MDEGQSFNFMKHFNNRPTSLKVELLAIPEQNSARNSYVQQDVSIGEHLGFRNLSYSVKEGLFKRSESIFYVSKFIATATYTYVSFCVQCVHFEFILFKQNKVPTSINVI